MAVLHPFRALRPDPSLVGELVCPPYDTMSKQEAKELARRHERNFLHVSRPDIDGGFDEDEHADVVYQRGADALQDLIADKLYVQDEEPSLWVYAMTMNGRTQVGIFGCVSVVDYDEEVILKHEKTRFDKEDDRTRHIRIQRAHAEPVMLTYRDQPNIDAMVDEAMKEDPVYSVELAGVEHVFWKVEAFEGLVDAFAGVPQLYIADGHHRCAAASRCAKELGGASRGTTEEFAFFPAVLIPLGQMQIMAYNRLVHELPGSVDELLEELDQRFGLIRGVDATPKEPGTVSVYAKGEWFGVALPAAQGDQVSDSLDVARLQDGILSALMGIDDPRTDKRISFVGGIRGTAALEESVNGGEAKLAISMFPTQPSELLQVSDAGEMMPPKSTWFEPKLASGTLVHLF